MKLVTLDFETFYSKDFSLSKMTTEAYIRDPQFQVIGFSIKFGKAPAIWVTGDDEHIRKMLGTQAEWDEMGLVAHNAAFDAAILSYRYGLKPKFIFDTLSMARPLTGLTVGGSLKALAEKFLIGQKGNEVVQALGLRREDFSPQQLAQYGEYCKNDTELTYTLFNILRTGFPTAELKVIDMMVRMFTEPVLELDKRTLIDHYRDVKEKRDATLMETALRLGVSNIEEVVNSNKKFAEAMLGYGITPPMKTSLTTGKPTYAFSKTDVEFKELVEHPDERVQALVSCRLGTKSTIEESRTVSFMKIAKRGTLPIMLNYYGAHTGRASGGDKINLQNLPRGGALRRSIIAPKGHLLVACDSAQIEARMNAWFSGQMDLVNDFANGVDIYSKFASEVYGYEVLKATHKIERHVGKTCILGLGYGMGAEKFQKTLKVGNPSVDMDIGRCQDVVKLYRAMYSQIAQNWKWCDKLLDAVYFNTNMMVGPPGVLQPSKEGLVLPNGMLIRYPNLRKDHDSGRGWIYDNRKKPVKVYGGKIVENIIQALARIVVFDQMLVIDKWLKQRSVDRQVLDALQGIRRVALTVHDEVVVCVPEDEAEATKAFMIEAMSQAPSWASGLPVACEADIGRSYGDAK